MRQGAAWGWRPDHPGDRGGPAGRLRRGRSRRDPDPGQRLGLLRLPGAVTGRHPAGLDLLGSSPDALGRHRTAGRRAQRSRAGQRQGPAAADHGRRGRVGSRPGVARRPQPVRDLGPFRLVESLSGRSAGLPAGPVPAGRGVRRPAVAAGREALRGAGRRTSRRRPRHRRDPAGRARPGQRPPDRPGPAVPGVRLRGVRVGPDHRHHRGRARRADTVISVEVPTEPELGREPAGPRAEPEHRLAAGSRLPADGAGGPADRAVGFGRARDRLPAGQPRGPGSRGRAAALHRLGARRSHLAGRPPAGPGEGLLHQPRHRHHRRELRRVQRVRPGLPRAAARPVGRRGRGRRDDGRAGPGRVGRGGRETARHPRRFGGRLDRAGRGDVGHRGAGRG